MVLSVGSLVPGSNVPSTNSRRRRNVISRDVVLVRPESAGRALLGLFLVLFAIFGRTFKNIY
jgi:hypothetical protein